MKQSQRVHLQQHLHGEEDDEEQVGTRLEMVKPWLLAVVFGGEHQGVQEHQHNDQPVELKN